MILAVRAIDCYNGTGWVLPEHVVVPPCTECNFGGQAEPYECPHPTVGTILAAVERCDTCTPHRPESTIIDDCPDCNESGWVVVGVYGVVTDARPETLRE